MLNICFVMKIERYNFYTVLKWNLLFPLIPLAKRLLILRLVCIPFDKKRKVTNYFQKILHILVGWKFSVASDGGRKKRHSSSSSRGRSIYGSENNSTHTKEAGSIKFNMEDIYKATKNFSPSLKIGQGGFGIVYKGCLTDGTVVAIKRAKKVHLFTY